MVLGDAQDPYNMPIILNNLMTPDECDHIIRIANKSGFQESLVGSSQSLRDKSRVSKTCWLPKQSDPVIKRLYEEIQNIISVPMDQYEDLQVVRYEKNNFFRHHYDQELMPNSRADLERFGHPRYCTILVYMSDPDTYDGGETEFPNLDLVIKEKKGTAVLFYNLNARGDRVHPFSLHGGSRIKKGIKYICNIWVRHSPGSYTKLRGST